MLRDAGVVMDRCTLPHVINLSTQPIIVCPLAFERDALVRCEVQGRMLCVGPGERGVERLAGMLNEKPTGPVILAGLAGAVDPVIGVGTAYIVSEVIGAEGERWMPSWRSIGEHPKATIATSRDVLTSIDMKQNFAKQTGAQLVDQESEPFARLATQRNWTWGIVRGVSDDLSTTLPPNIHTWVDESGRTKTMRVMMSLLKHPGCIGSLRILQRNSASAMTTVAQLLNATD